MGLFEFEVKGMSGRIYTYMLHWTGELSHLVFKLKI